MLVCNASNGLTLSSGIEPVPSSLTGVTSTSHLLVLVRKQRFQARKDARLITVSSAGSSQFKVVANKRDSLLPAAGSPAGWANRTAAEDALAVQGDEWWLDAFDIVDKKTHEAANGNGAPKL
ncbi:hypothetical protein FB451DRAFT_1180694 [Mycena latifolia]|nr:hypothetical protein FB451DRAFT_1180694 [Mycena latifolia]